MDSNYNYSTLFKKSQWINHSVEAVSLKNGMRGLFINVPNTNVMNIKIQFRAGMRYAKNSDIYEVAHLAEHLAFGANAKYKDEQAYEADFTKNGAYHNAWTSDFSVCYESECADFEWERILNLKRVAICQPKFNEDEIKSEKGNVKSELTGYMNDYFRLIWPKIQKSIGAGAPLTLKERVKTLNNITAKDLREHHRRTHTASNMRFIISGNLRKHKKAIINNLENWELKTGSRLEIPHDDLHANTPVLIRRKDASNLSFGFTWVLPRKLSTDELIAMDCLNHILTGSMHSRIFGKARKQGLIYGIGSTTATGPSSSSWDFDGEVNLDTADLLFDLIRTELTNILTGQITDDEITTTKTHILGRYYIGVQTVNQISEYYTNSFWSDETFTPHESIPAMLNDVDKSTITRLAREFIDTNIHAFAAVGATEKSLINGLDDKLRV